MLLQCSSNVPHRSGSDSEHKADGYLRRRRCRPAGAYLGVLVPGEPQEVINTLEANVPGAKFVPFSDGWMLKEDQWQRPDPWSLLLVRRYQDNFGAGTSIWCFAETGVLDPMQVLPDIEELLWKF